MNKNHSQTPKIKKKNLFLVGKNVLIVMVLTLINKDVLEPSYDWRRKWQPTPVFLPKKCQGQRSLAGYSPKGLKESDLTEHTHFSSKTYYPWVVYHCSQWWKLSLWIQFLKNQFVKVWNSRESDNYLANMTTGSFI